MARPLRIDYPGAVHHVTCRGNEQRAIFRDDEDRRRFLELLIQSVGIYGVKLFSYVLMNNHFHLLLETTQGNLSEFMRHFSITYTGYFNRRHNRAGHLYQGRYKSILVDKDNYLSILSRYIHLNPVRIKCMKKTPADDKVRYLFEYQWSSLPGFISRQKKQSYIDYGMVLEEYGGDTDRGRTAYRQRIIAEIKDGLAIDRKPIGGIILGSDEFIARVRMQHIKGEKDAERPSIEQINRHYTTEEILRAVRKTTGKDIDEIKAEKGVLRQIVMELLYRHGGLNGQEIGRMMDVGYTSVSQERGRLRERLQSDKNAAGLMRRIEDNCHG